MAAKPFVFSLLRDLTPPGDVWGMVAEEKTDESPAARARKLYEQPLQAEALGLDCFVMGDHFYDSPDPLIDCMASAAATKRLRVTQYVLANDFRNPAVVAKMIASIDVFSAGRVGVALGAGYNEHEYRQAGVAFEPAPVRVARLREGVQVVKQLLESDTPVTFKGEFYDIDDLLILPRPVQKPHPPISIGGSGKQMLKIAAEFADIIDLQPGSQYPSGLSRDPRQWTRAAVRDKIAWIRQCAGARFDSISLGVPFYMFHPATNREVGADEVREQLGAAYRAHGHEDGFPLTVEEVLGSPYLLIGSEDDMVQHVLALRRELGLTNFLIMGKFLAGLKPVVDRVRAHVE